MIKKMLSNPSKKLETFACAVLCLGSIASVISGITQWVMIGAAFDGFLTFIITSVCGFFFAWFLALLIEGFANIAAKAEEAADKNSDATETTPVIVGVNPDDTWNCCCGRKNSSYVSTCVCGKTKRDVTYEQPEA